MQIPSSVSTILESKILNPSDPLSRSHIVASKIRFQDTGSKCSFSNLGFQDTESRWPLSPISNLGLQETLARCRSQVQFQLSWIPRYRIQATCCPVLLFSFQSIIHMRIPDSSSQVEAGWKSGLSHCYAIVMLDVCCFDWCKFERHHVELFVVYLCTGL